MRAGIVRCSSLLFFYFEWRSLILGFLLFNLGLRWAEDVVVGVSFESLFRRGGIFARGDFFLSAARSASWIGERGMG